LLSAHILPRDLPSWIARALDLGCNNLLLKLETLGIAQDVDQHTGCSEINHDTRLEASLGQEMLVICRASRKLSGVDDEGA
jgi:hypothetical protein